MFDTDGRQIKIGDRVAYSNAKSSGLYISTVSKFTAKKVELEDGTLKYPTNVLVLN